MAISPSLRIRAFVSYSHAEKAALVKRQALGGTCLTVSHQLLWHAECRHPALPALWHVEPSEARYLGPETSDAARPCAVTMTQCLRFFRVCQEEDL
jgi:hypothetical protein